MSPAGSSVSHQSSTRVRRYGFAVFCVVVAFVVRYALAPLIGDELPFMLFVSAVLVAAAYGGAGPGVAAFFLGLFLGVSLFVRTKTSSDLWTPVGLPQLFRYFYITAVGIVLIEILHRSQARTHRAMDNLRAEIARRIASEERLSEAQAQISHHAEELELRVAERTAELEGLLYHIAHNLRAPLRAMEGSATLLQEEYGSRLDETARDYTRRISGSAHRMDNLIHDLLDFGRLSHVEVKLEPVELDLVVDHVLGAVAKTIKIRKAEIRVESPLPHVYAVENLTEQAIVNLVDNALKFVVPGQRPRIRIFAEERGSVVRLWVQDNGIGIEPQYYERIFGVFEQLNARDYEGTGIGLAIVKQCMHRMGGRTGIESRFGEGTKFWLEFKSVPASAKTVWLEPHQMVES